MKLWLRPRASVPARAEVSDDYRDMVAKRIASATRVAGGNDAVCRRIAEAPAGYLLAHAGSDVARHCALLEPVPTTGEVRVIATPGRARHTWHLDIAGRDRPGLLAMFSGVLLQTGVDVAQAVLATWDDGAALQALTIRSIEPPDSRGLQQAFAWSLDQGLCAAPVAGANVVFDQSASTIYTQCIVTGVDRPGLLHAVAVAIANAGADIHAASVATVDGTARDRFDLSDQFGAKLAPSVERMIAANLRAGFSGTVASRR